MMVDQFLLMLIGQALAAGFGGFAAWVAIRVDVALAKQTAKDAKDRAESLDRRITDHIERHHTIAKQ